MATLRFVLGDQLSRRLSSLSDLAAGDIVLMAEVMAETTHVPHHPRKIVLFLSAMRHFAAALREEGITVDYVALDDPDNGGDFTTVLVRAVARHRPDRVVVTAPGEWRVRAMMAEWPRACGVPVDIRDDDRFLCDLDWFRDWAEDRKSIRLEFFYRAMRRRTGLLMTDAGAPEGGTWNLDRENRKPPRAGLDYPAPPSFPPDAITRQVIDLVAARFGRHVGRLDGFDMAVTPVQAAAVLDRFVTRALPWFGDYQDAMVTGQPTLFHALIAPALNLGLLEPLDACRRAEDAWYDGHAPLNAVEGFIRQIIGWREYVRGVYWWKMPGYADTNHLGADRPLPDFYWSGDTDMACLAAAIGQTRDLAYAHHIQRLMVTGNFALLLGVRPREINAWYLAVYADAVEWVQLPNTHGMVMHADGGLLGSKPYAASGKYINRMSDYCQGCRYKPALSGGPEACPFNALYWQFLVENRDVLGRNPRLAMPYRTLDRMAATGALAPLQADAARTIARVCG